MIHDSTPHRIFKISELTRLIAGHLILINPKSAVNLACTCRYLEEPVLSTLWETQWSLCTLLGVLPEKTWEYENPRRGERMVRSLDPPLEKSDAYVRGRAAQNYRGSIARGLEQSPALRVLDAPSLRKRAVECGGGHLLQATPQFTCRRVVPSLARFILAHRGI